MGDFVRGDKNNKKIAEEMKSLQSSSITSIHDFLQDAQGFLEQTLASEKLTRSALEHRTRLITKLSALMKDYENHQMEMYIDMSPTLKSFFHSTDGSSSSDNSSIREPVAASEEFYDVPNNESFCEAERFVSEDQCDAPTITTLPPAPETKRMGFMQRLLKSRTKTSDMTSAFTLGAAKNRSIPNDEDDQSRRESGDSDILYDDAVTVKPTTEEELTYDDATTSPKEEENTKPIYTNENSKHLYTNEKSTLDEVYDDASQVAASNEEYEYVVNENGNSLRELHNNNNDSDGVSLKSGVSDYGANAPSHRWHITTTDAKAQALRYGCMKRRNGRKMLSTWRNCYAVLLPAHLLMYANDGDNRPRIVIDLCEPNIRVKRVVKQGVDTKRLKTHPFVLLHQDRPLYEMSTKSREETEEWIAALQAIVVQVNDSPESPTEKTDDDGDSVYEEPSLNAQQRELQSRIQGRNLPSLPATEQENKHLLQKSVKVNGSKMGNLFQFRGRKSSSDESVKRQSVDSSTNTDDLYQELPSPTASNTPYSSVENLKRSSEDIYNSVEDVGNLSAQTTTRNTNFGTVKSGKIQHSHSLSDGMVQWPAPPPEEDLPVYDIPSPTIRPLSCFSVISDEGQVTRLSKTFANQILKSRSAILNQQSNKLSGSVTVVSHHPEVYDVPASNPRPITKEVEPEDLKAYDRVIMPPRTVVPPPEADPPPTPAATKIARYWQEKISQVDKPLSSFKKSTSPMTKCLPKTSVETKSVGRCFSRTSPQRTPLNTLTELLASKNGVSFKPSALKPNVANVNGKTTQKEIQVGGKLGNTLMATFSPAINASNMDQSANKREPPPRPPAPIRSTSGNKLSDSASMTDELSQKLMKRAMKIEEAKEPQAELKIKDSATSSLKTVKEQYKARWAYVATNSTELSINSGEIVQVLTKNDTSWLVQARNKKGLVPKEYLVPLATNVLSLTKKGEAPITV